MIHIVEIPHQLSPTAWSRPDKEQIMYVINEASNKSGDTICDVSTGHELLDIFGYESTSEMRESDDDLAELANLIDAHGLDTTFYKGYGDDGYSVDPIDEWEAHLEWNGRDLYSQRIFYSDEEAADALANDDVWNFHQGVEARIALREQLEILCD